MTVDADLEPSPLSIRGRNLTEVDETVRCTCVESDGETIGRDGGIEWPVGECIVDYSREILLQGTMILISERARDKEFPGDVRDGDRS